MSPVVSTLVIYMDEIRMLREEHLLHGIVL